MNQQNKTERWEEEFSKYVYQEDDGKFVHTKVRRDLVEHDLFELKPPKGSMEYVVRLLVWYGETNRNVIRDVLELLSDARREERKRCLEAIQGYYDSFDYISEDYHTGIEKCLEIIQALTTAEESIRKIK